MIRTSTKHSPSVIAQMVLARADLVAKTTWIKFILEGVLGSLPLITNDEGPSYLGQAKRRKTASKAKRKVGDKNNLISTYGLVEDVYFGLPRDTDPMQIDGDQIVGDFTVFDLCFSSAHAR
ncbi:hypothetical protein Fot_32321 [Forsythia ovata]|uniref:Transposase n=1 Tax=Forsythia ovata TaxID=205694 RepID=A0ABD1T7J0_9LAMI